MRKRHHIQVKRGDIWEFRTNNGVIERHVRSVASGVVSYLSNGRFKQCSLTTFKRWARGAGISFAEDWAGRDAGGEVSGSRQ